jgi:hypothetical protein
MSGALSENQQKRQEMEAELTQLQESSKSEISQLYDRLEDKTKAGWCMIVSYHLSCGYSLFCFVLLTSGAAIHGLGG